MAGCAGRWWHASLVSVLWPRWSVFRACCRPCLYESLAQFKSSGLWVTTHAWLNDRFVLPESQQKNLAELKRSFLDPALKQINEKTPLLAKYSIDDSGKFLFSIIDKQNPV
ncbi:replication initiation protein [Klebsiella quasipneumoniae]|uniref:replication initiation protein n=1 Tax=Klebsiella quasipneumoniae TaxID=1463165 RepID=UPI0021BDCA50|nr:replication initiation protein [Klebsiella quasipneumoniae]